MKQVAFNGSNGHDDDGDGGGVESKRTNIGSNGHDVALNMASMESNGHDVALKKKSLMILDLSGHSLDTFIIHDPNLTTNLVSLHLSNNQLKVNKNISINQLILKLMFILVITN